MKRNRILALSLTLACIGEPGVAVAQGTVPELYRQSYALEGRGDIAGALASMDQIAAQGIADYLLSLRRGWLLYLASKHADSVTTYGRAIQLEPKAIEPRLGLMLPLMALRRWKDAEKQGLEVLALAPGDFTAQSRVAFIHYTQGQYAEAEGWYKKALAGFPSNVEMRVGLAWSLLKQSRSREARAEFERVLTVAPDHPSAKEGLAAAAP